MTIAGLLTLLKPINARLGQKRLKDVEVCFFDGEHAVSITGVKMIEVVQGDFDEVDTAMLKQNGGEWTLNEDGDAAWRDYRFGMKHEKGSRLVVVIEGKS